MPHTHWTGTHHGALRTIVTAQMSACTLSGVDCSVHNSLVKDAAVAFIDNCKDAISNHD